MVDVTELSTAATAIEGLLVITMKQVADDRGTVREYYRESAFRDASVPALGPWVQVNLTHTKQGAVRGIHAEDMTKLVAVAAGEAFGVWLDLRPDSGSYGKLVTVPLVPGVQVLVPRGVGNGFQATSADGCEYLYCFDREWRPGMAGIACTPLDPALGIDWPIAIDPEDASQVSVKDRDAPLFSDLGGSAT